MANVIITLGPAQARALRTTVEACLKLAEKSPVIADALDLNPDIIELTEAALQHLPIVHPSKIRAEASVSDHPKTKAA